MNHSTWFAAAGKWALIWILLPLFCTGLAIWTCERWLNRSAAPLGRTAPKLFKATLLAWDVCRTLPAGLVEGLPTAIQTRHSQYLHRWHFHKSYSDYSYKNLDHGDIRLLVLKRASWILPSTIKASLIHVPADHPLKYEALSYCWGNPTRSHEIIIDGERFMVTCSAFQLLRACRSMWREKTVWIDAICINQANNEEKAIQIQGMRRLYRRAPRVLAFPSSDYRLRLIQPLITRLSVEGIQKKSFVRYRTFVEGPESVPVQWRILAQLLSSDYFRRVWVFQEVVIGRTVDVYLGGLYVPWTTLATALANLPIEDVQVLLKTGASRERLDDDLFLTDGRSLSNIYLMQIVRNQAMESLEYDVSRSKGIFADLNARFGWKLAGLSANDLLIGLFYTNEFDATDARDRVFAILGLMQYNLDEELLRIDYHKSKEQVFEDVAQYLFFHCEQQSSVDILSFAGTGFATSCTSFRSWVPQLEAQRSCFRMTNAINYDYSFHASGDSHASIVRGNIPSSILVSGLLCDKVWLLSGYGPLETQVQYEKNKLPHNVEDINSMIAFTEGAMSLIDQHHDQRPGLQKRLWQCLIAGGDKYTKPYETQFAKSDPVPYLLMFLKAAKSAHSRTEFSQVLAQYSTAENKQVPEAFMNGGIAMFATSMIQICKGRRFGITQHGRMCLSPPFVEVGDDVFIPYGAQVPFLIRKKERIQGSSTHELVGEAYVDGIMMGEMMNSWGYRVVVRLT
ncbi:HET-domain-containing protein [Polychaeton citri CBS 116435]|uniref:HET-domain-containing protein n=1 Tax=Polychaeton citri CBS 116435 TaxID=1314669 RepID=A0A9P4Q0Y2_9PEZI|nr:HET-domain-containing protein [Polychaeton citri CBS 116435]